MFDRPRLRRKDVPEYLRTKHGIDRLLNAVFLEVLAEGTSLICLHADPPALIHGSLAGVTRSWHPDR